MKLKDPKARSSSPAPCESGSTAERRRLGRVIHDERGSATLEWTEVEADLDCDPLRLEGDPLSIESDHDTFNPYDRRPGERSADERPVKRDLRKLSEWIKKMREIERRKERGVENESDEDDKA